jgi:peptidoglycan-associated lipoprotein
MWNYSRVGILVAALVVFLVGGLAVREVLFSPAVTTSVEPAASVAPVALAAPLPAPEAVIVPGSANDFEANVTGRVFFAYDKSELDDASRASLKQQADWLARYPEVRLMIEGYCDQRGTEEYNLALGVRRADAVKNYLVGLGIAAQRVDTISYGKDRPVCTESDEACWSQNRRALAVVESPATPAVALQESGD